MIKKIFSVTILLFVTVLLQTSCNEEDEAVPYKYVNYDFSLSTYSQLETPCNHAIISEPGICGIIVYRNNTDELKAYDRYCPYDKKATCFVEPEEQNNPIVTCKCCGSIYDLSSSGIVIKGPSRYSLKEYNVSYSGRIIHIYN